MEQPLRSGPFEARRTVSSVTTLADGSGPQRLCEGADLDAPVLDAHLVAGLWRAGRAAHDAAIGEPEGVAGPWAGDAAIADCVLLQRAAHVSAGAGRGIHRSVCPVQEDRYAARVGPAELPIGQFGVGQHRRPL